MKLSYSMMLVTLAMVTSTVSAETRFRCGLLAALGGDAPCRWSCKLWGHTSGSCDEDSNCNCSEEPLSLRELLNGMTLGEFILAKVDDFREHVDKWTVSVTEKGKIASRCSLGSSFCDNTCRAIGRVNGTCNDDNTDCECSEQTVTSKQFALCVNDNICSLYCQSRDFARGECGGKDVWDCLCVSLKDGEEPTEAPDLVDLVDVRIGVDQEKLDEQ